MSSYMRFTHGAEVLLFLFVQGQRFYRFNVHGLKMKKRTASYFLQESFSYLKPLY